MNFSEFQISETKCTEISRTNYPLSEANGDLRPIFQKRSALKTAGGTIPEAQHTEEYLRRSGM